MSWDAIGAIGEVVGAIAVVVTLLFLLRQLRQNTYALRQQTERSSTAGLSAVSLEMMHPEVAEAVSSVFLSPDLDALAPGDVVPLEHFGLAYFFGFQQDFLDWRRALISDDTWRSREALIRGIMKSETMRAWFRQIGRAYFLPEFSQAVEKLLDEEPRDYFEPMLQR